MIYGRGISFILLAGGEPMLRYDVIEAASKRPDTLFPIFTNGTFMSEKYYELFDRCRNLIPIMSIWKAADGAIDPDSYRTVVRSLLTKSFAKNFIGKSDMNKPEDVQRVKEKFRRMQAWADDHPQYKDKTWDFNFDESRHKDRSFYYFTRCPINDFARKYGYLEILPVCCELDHILTEASKGRLIREYTLATGGEICDYWIVGDKLKDPR